MNAVDTNMLIYACDARDPALQTRAIDLIAGLRDGVLLWQVACEFIAASRKLHASGFSPHDAWARLDEFLDLLPLVPPAGSVLVRARELHLALRAQFWDCMIFAACVDAGIGRLYSQDLPGASVPGLEIVNPFA